MQESTAFNAVDFHLVFPGLIDHTTDMTVRHHPEPGTIVRVDLNEGFRPPEMTKRRPAIVLSPELPDRPRLCAIVPLSTQAPRTVRPYHFRLVLDPPLPHPYSQSVMWAKCDMVLTVAFHRLRFHLKGKDTDGARIYDVRRIADDDLAAIRRGVLHALGMDQLTG